MRKIALFDLDGTLADYNGRLLADLKKIAHPNDPEIDMMEVYKEIDWLEARRHMITCQNNWWLNLPKFKPGFDVLEMCHAMGWEIVVLTKGPSSKFNAWSEKVEWCKNHLTPYIAGVTITNDKSLVYGKVLVDDYPNYIDGWLKHRPRGLVIMPAHDYNEGYRHKNVVRYDGRNDDEVQYRLEKQFNGEV